jgi:hypothetical protein
LSEDSNEPTDALVVQTILEEMNIEHYDPKVVNQLLEFIYSIEFFNLKQQKLLLLWRTEFKKAV